MPSANSSGPHTFGLFYFCDHFLLCISVSISLPMSASLLFLSLSFVDMQEYVGSFQIQRGFVRGLLQCGSKAEQQSSWWLPRASGTRAHILDCFLHVFIEYVFMCICTLDIEPQHTCGCQKIACGSRFSLPTIWFEGSDSYLQAWQQVS